MKVFRTKKIKTEQYVIGDQIEMKIKGFDGKYTVTCHKVIDGKAFFLLDDYIESRPMNEDEHRTEGFENSDLNRWLQKELFPAFPKKIRGRLIGDLTIPSYGMLFGHDKDYENYSEDDDEQLELMKICKNRVAYKKNVPQWGWLRNRHKNSNSFAFVSSVGNVGHSFVLYPLGIRVGFWLQSGYSDEKCGGYEWIN